MRITPSVSAQLDSIRGLSAIVVLLTHVHQVIIAPLLPSQINVMGYLGQLAVMVFFALSGFLICNSILEGEFSPARYFRARFNRIYPPLALSLALVLVLWALAPFVFPTGTSLFARFSPDVARPGIEIQPTSLIGAAVFLNGLYAPHFQANAPLWSLPFEVWYYVVAGMLAMRPPWKVLGVTVFLLFAWHNRTFGALALVWFAGAFVALNWRPRLVLVTALILAAALAMKWYVDGVLLVKVEAFYRSICGVAFAALLYAIVHEKIRLAAPFQGSAAFSYTLYITHYPVLLFVYGALQPRLDASVVVTMAVAVGGFVGCLLLARALSVVEKWKPLGAKKKGAFVTLTA